MKFGKIIGQVLDSKYRIEKELGRGGMGTVYLATHVGTGRPVAVKVIAPQFMQHAEFVERFRREAKAAGRLRHPNVVNVTDFGFAELSEGQVAYLVMEYLDGCTLGEILEEEKKLPLWWTIDILEQVCSAVQEAHEQGIIHRDLKPDNIWLEPNQRGGYTVKVLDFGIAKLEESIGQEAQNADLMGSGAVIPTQNIQRATVAGGPQAGTAIKSQLSSTSVSEAATIAQTASSLDTEAGTMIQSNEVENEASTAILTPIEDKTASISEDIGTKLFSQPAETDRAYLRAPVTNELTHVGAVLGTPLYMSPEQCRGEKLSSSSDIYSMGVIAYQMLSGSTPFTGDFKTVMEAHREIEPPRLDVKKVPKKVKKVIGFALAKNPDDRPPSAQAFASELRAQSEGIGTLLQRALIIYSQHLPKFLGLAILLYLPVTILTILQIVFRVFTLNYEFGDVIEILTIAVFSLTSTFFGIFCGYLLFGTTTWIVSQFFAFPLRPVRVRPALMAASKKWKTFAGTGMLTAILTLVGYAFCVVPGLFLSVFWALVAPVVMMENLRGFSALKRSKMLVRRSLRTTIASVCIMFFVPLVISSLIAFVANTTVKALSNENDKPAVSIQKSGQSSESDSKADQTKDSGLSIKPDDDDGLNINIGSGNKMRINDEPKDMGKRIRTTIREALTQILLLPISILVGSFASIISALLYIKTRQVGGESLQDLLMKFEDSEELSSNWRKRVRERIQQTGKLSGKT